MTNYQIDQLNERQLTALEQGMYEYPPNLPTEVHQIVREAVMAYRNGDRSPEVVLCLAMSVTQACTNVLRNKVFMAFHSAGMTHAANFVAR